MSFRASEASRGIALVLTIYVGAALALRLFERSLLYVPGSRAVDEPAPALALNQRTVRFRAADSTLLSAWAIPAANATADAPWVLISHGNYGNIGYGGRPQFYAWFRDLGVNLLAYDYRSFGESEGVPSERGVYDDAEAAYRYLTDSLRVAPSRIVLFGHSLGTGVTVELARRAPAAGLIVEDAYTSVAERGQEVFPILPVKLIARSRFASIEKVGALTLPKLFLHARNDETIPIAHGRRVFAAAAGPKEWVELDAGHGDAYAAERARYYGAIGAFIRRVVAPTPVVADLEPQPGAAR
ncbi:MAG TPA: alpha/beta hydrolase [Gemmatimonadaceae bacterium]|nr:alpha/beta hydrolase [Gemmatimonadaceae bacterium]